MIIADVGLYKSYGIKLKRRKNTRNLEDKFCLYYLCNNLSSIRDVERVIIEEYYDHNTILVISKYEYLVDHVVLSTKEANIGPKELKRFAKVAQGRVQEVIKRHSNLLAGKKCSGILYTIVGNFAETRCGLKIFKEGQHRIGFQVIKRKDPKDVSWFSVHLDTLKNWTEGRIKGIKAHCNREDRDYRDDKLYTLLTELRETVIRTKITFSEKLKEYEGYTPEERALTITSTGLLRSMGIPTTSKNITPVYNSLRLAFNVKAPSHEPKTIEQILENICLAKRYDDTKEFKVSRSLISSAVQVLNSEFSEDEKVRKIRIFKEEDFKDCIEHALPLYIAHWLTRRGIPPLKWDMFYNLCGNIASITQKMGTIIDIRLMESFIDRMREINPKRPAFLLTSKGVEKAWRIVYYSFYRKRRRR